MLDWELLEDGSTVVGDGNVTIRANEDLVKAYTVLMHELLGLGVPLGPREVFRMLATVLAAKMWDYSSSVTMTTHHACIPFAHQCQ